MIPFLDVAATAALIQTIGLEQAMTAMAAYIAEDYRRWDQFDKVPRTVAHSPLGAIELMPVADRALYAFIDRHGLRHAGRNGDGTAFTAGGNDFDHGLTHGGDLGSGGAANGAARQSQYGGHRLRRAKRVPDSGFQGDAGH
jgi:hypothetical protein